MLFKEIIGKYYPSDDNLRRLLLHHSRQVAERVEKIVRRHPEWELDSSFLEDAAMLHDVGIFRCDAPGIHCHGNAPYLHHGILGAEILRHEAVNAEAALRPRYEQLARVCERHTGTGLTAEQLEILDIHVASPDLMPETLEEQIVCYADKFYSKSHPERERTIEQTIESLRKFGEDGVLKFSEWARRFEGWQG